MGKRFGFLRFTGIVNAEEFAKRLANIWIESFHLFAVVARFNRPQSRKVAEDTNHPRNRVPTSIDSKVNNLSANILGAKSFASVVNGGEKGIPMINREFEDAASCNAFRNNVAMKNVFASIKSVSQNFVIDERMIWIEISGLPLCAWGSNAYKRVANEPGKFMFFEIDQDSSLGIGRVCIATKQKSFISENVQVVINGEEYMVRVNEIATWNIKIEDDVVSEEAASDKDEKGDAIEEEESCDDNVNEIGLDQVEVSMEEKQQEIEVEEKVTHGEEKQREKEVEEKASHVDGDQEGTWTHSNEVVFMINIYGPHDSSSKVSLWNRLLDFIQHHNGKFIICGDLNEVRTESERFGSTFSNSEPQVFNSFIDAAGLIEIPMGGRSFTWMNKAGTKLSKLDRFLMSEDVLVANPDLKATVLDRLWSDHNPILLHADKTDFGPILFKLFHSWMQRTGFDAMIKESSEEYNNLNSGLSPALHKRLKYLKQCIKNWRHASKQQDNTLIQIIQAKFDELDIKIDSSTTSDEDRNYRLHLMKDRDDLELYSTMDIAQKARIRWDVEGDENTKFFNGIIKAKRRNQMVQGVLVNGEWLLVS
ncbi:cytochrome P450 [Artemisia annua]|uniref:Cytochrome P450 n=1 Tax=Artemisia annua TaxID=35608 RepID=A0A2U1PXD9_ARTAN|nr:cytochrome P450 [Artemisia annua]